MAKVEKSIELDVPVHTAYSQITRFEEFPKFMSDVREVRQIDDTHLHWRAEVGSKEIEWDAEIADKVPDQRIAWRSTQGSRNNGEVSFTPLGENRTRITYVLDLEPPANAGGKAGKADELSTRTERDLQSFKRFIESLGTQGSESRGEEPGEHMAESDRVASQRREEGAKAADSVVRAARTAADQTSQLGKKAIQTAGENIGRAGQQVNELTSQALHSQQAIQSSALEAANAALRPFRASSSLPLGAPSWFSAMLNAFDEPFSVMRRFSEEMHHELEGIMSRNRDLLGSFKPSEWAPNVDISQEGGQLTVHADLPGIRREDVNVEVDSGHLVIRGERRARQESNEQGQHRVECNYGSFMRVIPLPEEVDLERAEASLANGVLQVRLPMISSSRGHRIEVRDRDEQQEQRRAESAADTAGQGAERNRQQPQRNAA